MNDDIFNSDKVKFLRDELIEVCSEWNLTTKEKFIALQECMKIHEEPLDVSELYGRA